jgi:serine/threonine-protein kinase
MSEEDTVDTSAQTMLSGSADKRDVTTSARVTFEGERYTTRRVLGAGGMGEVRLCDDAWIGRDVAMKVAKSGHGSASETRGRFLREARVQGQLEHPSIVPVYDIGLHRGETFFTMKRIGGHTLEEIARGLHERREEICVKYNRRKLLSAMSQVCLTIAYAHSRGVIHRDLKPANVMLGDFGEVYVLDWGVAKLASSEDPEGGAPVSTGERSQTQAGAVIGTPGYMPPEQLAGEPVGPRSDVYALGAILFELLALEPMNMGASLNELVAATAKPAQAPSARRPSESVPPELDAIVLRATHLDPSKRFESARAMHEAIEAFLDGERDAERRRALASDHVKNARAALARASDPNEDGEARRAEGMRELGRAVALDPSDAGALRAISELVLAPASDLPKTAIEELRAGERADRAKAAVRASRMYLIWLALVPLLWVMGIRSWAGVGAIAALILMTSAWTQWVGTQPTRATMSRLMVAILLNGALIATCSLIFGPLVFVPTVAATSAAAFVLAVRDKTWMRYVPFTVGTLAVFIPLALELAGILPRAYTFSDGMIAIHPAIADFHAERTPVALVMVTFVQMMLPAVVINRAVDNLVDAERRSFAQAWRLRQLLP